MNLRAWLIRCVPGLSILGALLLTECALQIVQTWVLGFSHPIHLLPSTTPVLAQLLFVPYCLALHLLAFIFPLRLCRSAWLATKAVQAVHGTEHELASRGKEKADDDAASLRRSLSSQRQNQLDILGTGSDSVHTIMIPSYKEDPGVLEDTLKVLSSHNLAASHYDVFLAMEERDPVAISVAENLLSSFKSHFRDMQYTLHPAGLPGEVPGKSSNISWAAQQVRKKYDDSPNYKDILLTVMDSDTHLLSHYFDLILIKHASNQQKGIDMTLYMPPIIFDRNAHKVPTLVRVADFMWLGAGLSCFQAIAGRTGIAFPTSVYTLPLPLVRVAQGWDTGPGAIGEDMHMMLKCYFATHGKLAIQSIASPASQCNVSSSKSGLRGWLDSHRARYSQALRHMWGCLDTGYAVDQWLKLGNKCVAEPLPPLKLSHNELEVRLSHYVLHGDREKASKATWRNTVLFTRMFEAHFLPTHLMVLVIASSIYSNLSAPLVQHRLLTMTLNFTAILRAMSFSTMIVYFFVFFEHYHRVCVEAREFEMKRAGLYEEMKDSFTRRSRSNPLNWLDYVLFPIAGSLFGCVPLFHAAFAHFWSDYLVYTVSEKPKRAEITFSVKEGHEEV